MLRRLRPGLAAPALCGLVALAGCGSSSTPVNHDTPARTTATTPALPKSHPQAVEPVAGNAVTPGASTDPSSNSPTPSGATGPTPKLTGPASETHAPSKGAPTDAEVRAAVAKFQLAVAQYHLDRLDFSGVLLNLGSLPPGVFNTSIASVYTDYGLPIACGGVLHVPELGVANKTLPCGTMVLFRYGSRAIRVPVIDRGPYIAGREWDLTGATAEALRFPGLGPIQWRIG
jgi:rare lipoprotein A (peptidoglycan hydrolase)